MTPELLATLMLVAPLIAMLFVAWGVRGPSWQTLNLWREQARNRRAARFARSPVREAFTVRFNSTIVRIARQMAERDAAIADGEDGEP